MLKKISEAVFGKTDLPFRVLFIAFLLLGMVLHVALVYVIYHFLAKYW